METLIHSPAPAEHFVGRRLAKFTLKDQLRVVNIVLTMPLRNCLCNNNEIP